MLLVLCLLMPGLVFGLEDPQALVIATTDKVLAKLDTEQAQIKKNPKHIYNLIDDFVLPHFDFERMSRWVLGKYWRKASKSQQARFLNEFRTLLVRTYASSLLEFSSQKIVYLPFRGEIEKQDVTIRSEVDQPGSFPIPINYRLHVKDGKWLVYDVTIDDISLIANYRTSFSTEIRKNGIDKLISQLADKNAG